MITKPTVLILGAGASMPYGFYSGAGLVEEICRKLRGGGSEWKIINDYFIDYLNDEVIDFANKLSLSGRQSIDVFLMNHPEYEKIGKVAIAAVLINCENHNNLFGGDKSKWYQFLFNNLGTDFETFGENKLAIITYNYDRSLEFYLKTVLENSYGKSEKECIDQLKKIPIIHMHGNLGNLPRMGEQNIRKYEPVLSGKAFSVCEQTIRVIHESIDSDDQFKKANELIKEAEIICFLGFGYDKTNIKRLNLKESDLAGKLVFGTAFEMGKAGQGMVKSYFANKIILGQRHEKIEMFLDDYPVILRPE